MTRVQNYLGLGLGAKALGAPPKLVRDRVEH